VRGRTDVVCLLVLIQRPVRVSHPEPEVYYSWWVTPRGVLDASIQLTTSAMREENETERRPTPHPHPHPPPPFPTIPTVAMGSSVPQWPTFFTPIFRASDRVLPARRVHHRQYTHRQYPAVNTCEINRCEMNTFSLHLVTPSVEDSHSHRGSYARNQLNVRRKGGVRGHTDACVAVV
jgi:hypothetical protein